MGNQKKAHKRQEREDKKRKKGTDVSVVLYALAIPVALVAFLVVREKVFNAKVPDSYETSVPDEIIPAEHISPELRPAISVYLQPESHMDKSIRGLPNNLKDWPPGERGVGVTLDESKMPTEEVTKRKAMYKQHAFEEYVSNLISPNRSLPDWRGDWCRNSYDPFRPDLEPTSVVICFHNEAWSTLIRTVHSIINRTPPHLLEEILLIDDMSTMEHLGEQLDEYMKRFPQVRIFHQTERHGLIRCRMFGSTVAKGKVLTYLDSHVEAGIGWLEPLLYRVKDEPKMIVSPVIDAINDTTFWYTFIEKDLRGLMNWNMVFEWYEVPPEERARKVNPWAPHTNPIMSGGLFTINKDWFQTLGYYDTGMEIWGGENFEVSFKNWMCGGKIEVAPCSRVGHVFRTWSPYKVDTKKNVAYNNIRVAEVWMDEFKYLYFDRLGHLEKPVQERLDTYGYGDQIEERKKFREELGCKSFKWYLDNVAKGFPYHSLIGAGEIKNEQMGFCLDQNDRLEFANNPVFTIPCHKESGNQYWWLNANRYLMRDYSCIGVLPDGVSVVVMDCGKARGWDYDEARGTLKQNGKCLSVGSVNNIYTAVMQDCREGDALQKWRFSRFDRRGLRYEDFGKPAPF